VAHDRSIDWHLLDEGPYHRGLQRLVRDLNHVYRRERALHELDADRPGSQWIDCTDSEQSVVSFVAAGPERPATSCSSHATSRRCRVMLIGSESRGSAITESSSIATRRSMAGSNLGNAGGTWAGATPWQGQPCSLELTLPPLAVLILKPS
jgi:1,4-alpha-glucan branching enzyme